MLKLLVVVFLLTTAQSRQPGAHFSDPWYKTTYKNVKQAGDSISPWVSLCYFIFKVWTYVTNFLEESNVEVNIINRMKEHTLDRPTYHLESGQCTRLCPIILNSARAFCKFEASFPFPTTEGVIIYEIKKTRSILEKLVIYFVNTRLKDNKFCVFLSKNVDEATILKQIRSKQQPKCKLIAAEGSSPQKIENEGEIASIYASMSNMKLSQMDIYVSEKFDGTDQKN